MLVSSIPRWWGKVAKKIVHDFTTSDSEFLHTALSYIISIMPTSTSLLSDVFKKNYPHKNDSAKIIVRYVSNLLKVIDYAPEVRTAVWGLIVEKTVELDVELQDELDFDDEDMDLLSDDGEEDEEVDDTIAALEEEDLNFHSKDNVVQVTKGDGDSDAEDEEDDSESDEDVAPTETGVNLSVARTKLDLVMSLLLRYLDDCLTESEIQSGDGQKLFVTLQNLFSTYILSTYRTRSIQFLLFWASHASPVLMDAFVASLLETALSPRENIEKRLKAMQYISSFIARAKGLTQTQVVFTVSILAGWLDSYVEEREAEVDSIAGGMGRFRMFYSVTQTMMYIFCFRHSLLRKSAVQNSEVDGVKNSSDSQWVCDLDKLFRRLIITKFNPLRYCRKTVVATFAQIANKEDLVYCFTIMEQNRLGGNVTGASNGSNKSGGGVISGDVMWKKGNDFVMLDAYFPFDPLPLPLCKRRVQDIYVEWDDVDSGSGSDDEEEEDDEEGDNDDNDDDDDEDDEEEDEEDEDMEIDN